MMLPAGGIGTIFVDIDGTLTHGRAGGRRALHPLVELLMQRGVAIDAAREAVRAAEAAAAVAPGMSWPFGADRALGIETAELTAHILATFPACYAMHPDANRFMTGLRRWGGPRVYPATTNPGLFILGKLASGGLADATGTPVFDACFGGEEVCSGGKAGPGFYEALLARTGSEASACIMVGDEPEPDLTYARAADIRTVFIVCRDQPEPLRHGPDGGLFVNSLDVALAMIGSDKERHERT